MNGVTDVCGLRVGGRLAPVGRRASGTAELVMEAGHVTYPVESELLKRSQANGQAVSICQSGDVAFVRLRGVADVALDVAAGTATIDVSASSPPGMDEVVAAGPVLALALALRGQPCLHASAVSISGQAVAFTAPSGGGSPPWPRWHAGRGRNW